MASHLRLRLVELRYTPTINGAGHLTQEHILESSGKTCTKYEYDTFNNRVVMRFTTPEFSFEKSYITRYSYDKNNLLLTEVRT